MEFYLKVVIEPDFLEKLKNELPHLGLKLVSFGNIPLITEATGWKQALFQPKTYLQEHLAEIEKEIKEIMKKPGVESKIHEIQ